MGEVNRVARMMGDLIVGKNEDFSKFLEILLEATKRIESHYFQLPVAGKKEAIYRERVYSYELYHQIRKLMPNDFQYVLNGEVDKAGHPYYRKGRKPDFIVHVPGTDKNLAVVEIKPLTAGKEAIRKDFGTLRSFLVGANYFRAAYLIYGGGEQKKFSKFEKIKKETCSNLHKGSILLIWHQEPIRRAIVMGSDRQIS